MKIKNLQFFVLISSEIFVRPGGLTVQHYYIILATQAPPSHPTTSRIHFHLFRIFTLPLFAERYVPPFVCQPAHLFLLSCNMEQTSSSSMGMVFLNPTSQLGQAIRHSFCIQ